MKDFLQTRKNRKGIHLIFSKKCVILILFLSLVGFYLPIVDTFYLEHPVYAHEAPVRGKGQAKK